jgi:hypothetical protein
MSLDKSCLFYDKCTGKTVPCFIVPNEFYSTMAPFNRELYVKVILDPSKFVTYGITPALASRFIRDVVRLETMYPASTQTEIDYALACMPTAIADEENHYINELIRYEKLVSMLCDFEGFLSLDFFYTFAEFVAYELTVVYGNTATRQFMLALTQSPPLSEQPTSLSPEAACIIRMTRTVFNKCQEIGTGYEENDDPLYYLTNYRRTIGMDALFSQVPLRLKVLRNNLNFIIC